MPNYLFECEVVGGSVISPSGKELNYSIIVIPINNIHKSDLINGIKPTSIALEECASEKFTITPNALLKSIPLKETGEIEFVIEQPSIAEQLFSFKKQRVVLELNDETNPKIIGFKAQF